MPVLDQGKANELLGQLGDYIERQATGLGLIADRLVEVKVDEAEKQAKLDAIATVVGAYVSASEKIAARLKDAINSRTPAPDINVPLPKVDTEPVEPPEPAVQPAEPV